MCVKIDLNFRTVCQKMSENRRPQGGRLTHTVELFDRARSLSSWTEFLAQCLRCMILLYCESIHEDERVL